MAKKCYVGDNNLARKVSKIYVGVNGVARKLKKAYVGVNGIARQWWEYEVRFTSIGSYSGVLLCIPTIEHSKWGNFLYQSTANRQKISSNISFIDKVRWEDHTRIVYAFYAYVNDDYMISPKTPVSGTLIEGNNTEFYVMPQVFFDNLARWSYTKENWNMFDTTQSPYNFAEGRYACPPTYINCTSASQVYGTVLRKGSVIVAWQESFFNNLILIPG